MTPEQFQAVKKVFIAACDLSGEERTVFVAKECGDDPALRAKVEAMLALDGDAETALESKDDLCGTPAEESRRFSPTPQPVIEGFDILHELHRGGQGIVYEAVQKSTKRKVAIKLLLEGVYASRIARKRFERETVGS